MEKKEEERGKNGQEESSGKSEETDQDRKNIFGTRNETVSPYSVCAG